MLPESAPKEMTQKGGVVKWISSSEKNNSFNLEEDSDVWYVLETPDETFIEDLIHKGDKVKFFFEKKGSRNVVEKIDILVKKRNPEVIKRSSEAQDPDDMLNLEKLLDKAHQDGMKSIHTEIISLDMEKKTAVFKATVTMPGKGKGSKERVFTGHGDALPDNLKTSSGKDSFVAPHYIRMAETRAIVRALRWATNQAKAAEEEKS